MLLRVFYVSQIVGVLSDVDIQVILGAAQMRNRRLDVTGVLVRSDGHFAQVIEGRADVVEPLLERIRQDGRHTGLRVMLRETAARRLWVRWAMHLVERDDVADELDAFYRRGKTDSGTARLWMHEFMADPDAA